jgi:hypothetical protein
MGLVLVPVAQASLIGRWTFNEGSGTTAFDSSGNGNNGTINGGASYVNSAGLYALDLDGVDDWVDMGNPALFDITGSFSLAAWVRIDDKPLANGATPAIIGKNPDAYQLGVEYSTTPGQDKARGVSGNTAIAESVDPLAYEHLVVVKEAGDQIVLYRNGVFSGGIGGTANPLSSADVLRVGLTGASQFLDAMVDQVEIYNHNLSGAEVAALFAANPIPEPSTAVLAVIALVGLGWRRLQRNRA